MVANAIAMKYQPEIADSSLGDSINFTSPSFLYQYPYLPQLSTTSAPVTYKEQVTEASYDFEERRLMNLSFATERYLQKHNIGVSKSNAVSTNDDVVQQTAVTQLAAVSKAGGHKFTKEPATRRLSSSSEDADSDSETFNILDLDKLRSLPKLL